MREQFKLKKKKKSKINILSHSYELFSMNDNETIVKVFTRFTNIINGFQALGKTYKESKKVMKILRSLPKKWEAKVDTIYTKKLKNLWIKNDSKIF